MATFIGSASSATDTIDLSATGRLAGDVLLISGFASAATPAGWTMAGAADTTTPSGVDRPLWWRVSDGTEGNVVITGATKLVATVWRGVDSVLWMGDSTTAGAAVYYDSLAGLLYGAMDTILYTVSLTVSGGSATVPPNPGAPVTERVRQLAGANSPLAIMADEPAGVGTIPSRRWTWGGLESAIRVRTYGLYIAAVPGVDWYEVRVDSEAPINVGTDLCNLFTGLDCGTGHTLQVRRCNDDGCSDWSALIGITLPCTPIDLTAVPTETSIEFCWVEDTP